MARVILKIGYEKFYLPTDKGIMTVINTLSKAVKVQQELGVYKSINSPKVFVEDDCPVDMSVVVLGPHDVVRRRGKSQALPEQAGPDSDGHEITKRDR